VAARLDSKSAGPESECRWVTASHFGIGLQFLIKFSNIGFHENLSGSS
jgi:hypothetical protein